MEKNIVTDGLPSPIINYISHLEARNKSLESQVDNLMESLRLLQKARFGSSSEKLRYILTDANAAIQETLFNEAEAVAEVEEAPEPVIVKKHVRKPKRTKEELAKELPVHDVIIDIPEEERICNICESDLHPIGKELVRSELSVIPAQAYLTKTYRVNYSCCACHKETDEANIVKPQVPVPVVNKGLASPSSIAYTMYQKYVNAQPLYRQEKDWGNFGVDISRGTLANWMIYACEHWLISLWDAWKVLLLVAPIIFADETVIQVLKEKGKTPQSESRMWVYGTGTTGPAPIVLYEYQPSRSGEHAKQFLQIDEPFYLQTDAYIGYDKVANAIHCGCYSHLRRKFNEAMPKSPPKDNPAYIGLRYCQKLFKLEEEFAELLPDERLRQRQQQSKPVVDAFFAWIDTLDPLAGSKLATAVTYARNQRDRLQVFLQDGRIEISTNRIENAIRPFAVGRRNWLFADTVKGARSSAIAYSIIETAKLSGINPYEYLLYVLTELPTVLTNDPNADLSAYFPWANGVADRCRSLKKEMDHALLESKL